ncbi:aspartokinase I/homoserine dehydrogenase, threonine-sensitive [Stigmatella aurantiaca DW4/3-1]|uniref:Homoserine O-acetyltransferase n=1 Tax=Stigmatella aurantiaca (strain DW4/3-1) TaxID=378806 RepID=Q09AD2_STIAD|nr:aspartokinase I/homoserine dehydrogenase, threonine-sensitive [Stigmatella aurantiaca DW4/3-1]
MDPRGFQRPDPSVPTVLLVHALTGDMRAGGPGGWWEPLIGPGRVLDPERVRLLCFNNLGSCYGSSGPADEGFPSRGEDRRTGPSAPLPPGERRLDERSLPATVTPWDQARAILQALDALGIQRVELLAGGSLGGMIVLCLAVLAPERFERLLPIAACEAASSWIVGWNHVARQALLLDLEFPEVARRGLELARQLAMLTYRAEPSLEARQARASPDGSSRALFPVQSYLEHQGRQLRARFDTLSYYSLLGAMDHHDLARPPEGTPEGTWGVSRIRASTLCVGIDRDQLFFPEHMLKLSERLRALGRPSEYAELSSLHGHDGFLIEWGPLEGLVRRALALPAPESTPSSSIQVQEPRTEVNVLLLGHGTVGGNLLEQLQGQQEFLERTQGVCLRVCGIVDTRHFLFQDEGISLSQWRERLTSTRRDAPETLDLPSGLDRLRRLRAPVLVDCTAADGMEHLYAAAFQRGIHVVSANKKPLTMPWPLREQLFSLARTHRRIWNYETTVGASLPVLRTLTELVRTGDRVWRIEGCLSGSLGFLCEQLMQGVALSRAVRLARDHGYTEPHPREDLMGLDVARKALILARELGLPVSLEDIGVEPFLPKELLLEEDVERFLGALEGWDRRFASRMAGLRAEGRVLRYLARIETPREPGHRPVLKVEPVAVPPEHPAAGLRGAEALVAFTTGRHAAWPLMVRGAGAGGAVTAAGVLAGLLGVAQGG